MRKTFMILSILTFVGVFLAAHDFNVQEKEEIQKTLKFQDPSKPKEVLVDNVFGSIKVEGTGGQEVLLLAQKTIKARTGEKIQKAKEEVRLDISEEGNTVELYVNGPFRCHNQWGDGINWRDPGYEVQFDFELKVPHQTNLTLKTVNCGDIMVKNVEGEFEVKNVNGKIEMTEISGSGIAHTVNGKLKVVFTQNPKSDCSFKTINGELELFFPEAPSADFRLKTFNGEAFSDFPFSYLPRTKAVSEQRKEKFIYKSDGFSNIRIGKGGPEIKLDTLNGNIFLNKR
jgi:hypothetical protein